jgi:NDP-sugar pyrophosphorylase family protein
MKAMILAAGLGTRLRPLTDDRPKALVQVAGHALLELTLLRLRSFGVHEVIINTHHFADQVVEFLRAHRNFGMSVEISREEELLDTGGGLKKAAAFFLAGKHPDEPFLLHNVDVLSSIDLTRMVQFHREHASLATLAVQLRPTSRYLLFDRNGQLCGRRAGLDGTPEWARAADDAQAHAFCGIHVLSKRIFSLMQETGTFSIIPVYLRLAALGERILAFPAENAYWRDLGRPESIKLATRDFENGLDLQRVERAP